MVDQSGFLVNLLNIFLYSGSYDLPSNFISFCDYYKVRRYFSLRKVYSFGNIYHKQIGQ